MDGLGWGDIAYHYIIGKDGLVYEARPAPFAGDTATNYDPDGHLLVVIEGNFDEENPTQAQLDALVLVVAWSAEEWDVSLDDVSGHRDHAATSCPGANLYPFIASGDLARLAAEMIDAGGVWAVRE
jgi:N-acetyl-anhydromuramyl-L-alanine amidase AmpD